MNDRLDELIFAAIRGRTGSSVVDIPTILDRVDSSERWLLSFEELDGGLRRLSDAERIGEVSTGQFIASGSSRSSRPYSGLSAARYDAAVEAYRTSFAAAAVAAMRSPVFRGFTSLMRMAYRVTGRRMGLAREWIDLDAVAIAFTIDGLLAGYGAQTGDPIIDGSSLTIPIIEGSMVLDRSTVVARVETAIRQHRFDRIVVLRFADGDETFGPT
jgi:hypothetical protein